MKIDKKFCVKHAKDGDTLIENEYDAFWRCDTCSQHGINPCGNCGGVARYFGEALMSYIGCEDCGDSIFGIALGMRKELTTLWNKGVRGKVGEL